MENTAYLDNFEKILSDGLVKVCQGASLLDDSGILDSPDIDLKWDVYIKDYVADAVENFNSYPQTAIAWAGFLGMGVAHRWDRDFELFKSATYQSYYGPRGFDDMDEFVLQNVLGLDLDGAEARKISDTFNSMSMLTLGLIRHEGVEPQTAQGFYILNRSYTVLYKIGASIALRRLGYRKVLI